MLPESFGPTDLGIEKTMFEQQPQKKTARFEKVFVSNKNEEKKREKEEKKLFEIAKNEIHFSHSPYTDSQASVVIQTKDGKIGKGVYIESAAYNPSLPPLQSALINLNSIHLSFDQIDHVFILQNRSLTLPSVSHLDTSLLLLKHLSNDVHVTCYDRIQQD